MHDLSKVLGDPTYNKKCQEWLGNLCSISRLNSPIAFYMFRTKIKYGFLNTYDNTVFLRQEPSPGDHEKFILRCSSIIKYSTQSAITATGDFSDNMLYLSKASLRECFLFLVSANHSEPFVVSNPMTWQEHLMTLKQATAFIHSHFGKLRSFASCVVY
jgi:hypothetical protein